MELDVWQVVKILVDFTLVSYIIYNVIKFTRKTKVMTIFKGIGVIVSLWLLSTFVGLSVLKFLLEQVLVYGIFVLLILFQTELRAGLEKMGKKNYMDFSSLFSINKDTDGGKFSKKEIESFVESASFMSDRKIGALISIEIEDSLDEYIATGISLNSKISKELLINIFTPNVPLHDGALIIKDGRIESASCYLPLSQSDDISKELGTRHRAAVGLSEKSDALTIIVSEETGDLSITRNGKLYRGLEIEEFRRMIEMVLLADNGVAEVEKVDNAKEIKNKMKLLRRTKENK